MNNCKSILISLLVLFISFLFVDEGKTISFISHNIQIHFNHSPNTEIEIPHQHNFNKTHDDEKLMNPNSFDLECSSEMLLFFPYYLNKRTEDFTGLIWQPPRYV
jgi:hypothetical protein